MSLITRSEIETLIAPHEAPCITLTMPTHRKGPDVLENPIRLKNLLDRAEERLVGAGQRAPEVRTLLEPARDLVERNSFWQRQSDGLLLYLSPDLFRTYRLPSPLEDLVVVSTGFHIKPLLPLLAYDERFFVLALSQDAIRLYQGTRFSVAPVSLRDIPRSLEEALLFEEAQQSLHWHAGQRAGLMAPRHGARQEATGHEGIFHGIGYGSERDAKEEMLRYFNQIDEGLNRLLGDEASPLVLAGVGYVLPIYRQANSLPTLVEEGIEGSPKMLSARELHARAWEILAPRFRASEERAREQFESLLGRDDPRAITDPAEAVRAAYGARIHALFVARTLYAWGRFDPETMAAREEPDDDGGIGRQDLLDLAVAHTYLNKGEVHVVEAGDVPGGGVLAGVLRY